MQDKIFGRPGIGDQSTPMVEIKPVAAWENTEEWSRLLMASKSALRLVFEADCRYARGILGGEGRDHIDAYRNALHLWGGEPNNRSLRRDLLQTAKMLAVFLQERSKAKKNSQAEIKLSETEREWRYEQKRYMPAEAERDSGPELTTKGALMNAFRLSMRLAQHHLLQQGHVEDTLQLDALIKNMQGQPESPSRMRHRETQHTLMASEHWKSIMIIRERRAKERQY